MIKARSIPMPVRRRKADFQRPLKIVTVRYRKGICRQDMITQPGHTWTQRHCTPRQPPSRKVSKPSDKHGSLSIPRCLPLPKEFRANGQCGKIATHLQSVLIVLHVSVASMCHFVSMVPTGFAQEELPMHLKTENLWTSMSIDEHERWSARWRQREGESYLQVRPSEDLARII